MKINFLTSFDRSFKKLPLKMQDKTINAIDALLEAIEMGKIPKGLGLKKLRKNFWEIRIDIRCRLLLEFSKDTLTIIFVGDHDSLKEFLKGK